MSGELAPQHRRPYLLSGNATATIVSRKSGTRFTYKVQRAPERPGQVGQPPFFVSVLTGPENGSDYTFLGTIFVDTGKYFHGRKSSIAPDAPSEIAFDWAWRHLDGERAMELAVYHLGKCGRCGRALTTPESIERGLGPVCAGES